MSDPGYGLPIDPLDTACKTYRECIWCVNKSFEGGLCQPETVAYGAPTMDENGITCTVSIVSKNFRKKSKIFRKMARFRKRTNRNGFLRMLKIHANELSVNVTNSWPLVSPHSTPSNSDPDSNPAYFSLTRHLNPNINLF